MVDYIAQVIAEALDDIMWRRDIRIYTGEAVMILIVLLLAGAHIWYGGKYATYIREEITYESVAVFAVYLLVILLYIAAVILFRIERWRLALLVLLIPTCFDIGILGLFFWAILHV